MSHEKITWDELNHPNLITVYDYFHYSTFTLSTILTLLATYIILTKSTNAMAFYRYILLNGIVWNYLFDVIYFLWRPVNLFPYFIFYSRGVFKDLPKNSFIFISFSLGFCLFGIIHSMW